MRFSVRSLVVANIVVIMSLIAAPSARAQAPVPLEGNVLSAVDKKPIEGAAVDIYRTDIRGKFLTRTDAKGHFTYNVPQQGVFTIVVSAPGYAPGYRPNIRLAMSMPRIDIALDRGNGLRPSTDEVERFISSGGLEDPAAAAARAKEEAEYAKALEIKNQFDARKVRFDAGVVAMGAQDYALAITEFSEAINGLEDAKPEDFGELIGVGGANLAEAHYQLGVALYNQSAKETDKSKREAAKDHLSKGAKAIALAIKFRPAGESVYAIQGKTLALLVDKFGETDQAETGANAFLKAAEKELDSKRKNELIVQAGDVYRNGFLTEQAVSTYKIALASDPGIVSAYYGIGLACMGTTESDDAKRREIWQTAADYLKVFADKAAGDPKAAEVKGLLDMLSKDFKIKPRPLK